MVFNRSSRVGSATSIGDVSVDSEPNAVLSRS